MNDNILIRRLDTRSFYYYLLATSLPLVTICPRSEDSFLIRSSFTVPIILYIGYDLYIVTESSLGFQFIALSGIDPERSRVDLSAVAAQLLLSTDFFDASDPESEFEFPELPLTLAPEAAARRPLEARGTYRQVFLTVWRGSEEDISGPSTFQFSPDICRSCEGQRERCSDTEERPGRLHEHYWIQFTRPVRVTTFERMFNPPLHSGPEGDYHGEAVWGTNEQVHAYVTKVRTRVCGPWRWGEPVRVEPVAVGGRRGHQGRRSDLEEAKGFFSLYFAFPCVGA